jgi:prepilin-type N-terminal cleavage/methylation domain-containing protein
MGSNRRRTFPRTSRPAAAFTLIEVLLVLVVAGVLAALAYPRLDVSRYRADAMVQGVRSAMQQAQRQALVGQHDVIVSFDTTAHRVRVIWDANNDQLLTTGEHVKWVSLEPGNHFTNPGTGVAGSTTKAVEGPGIKIMDGMQTVTFHRDGSLSSDIEVYMTTPGKGTALVWRAVTVIQSTGRSEWFRRNPTTGNWQGASL